MAGGPAGQAVITAPFAGPVLNSLAQPGGPPAAGAAADRTAVSHTAVSHTATGRPVRAVQAGPFTRREAVNYLTGAFRSDPDLRLGAPDLSAELGCLPMALGHACAVMLDGRLDCREYLRAFTDRRGQLTGSVPDIAGQTGCPVEIIVAWSLAVDRAIQASPGGVAWPILALAACLDPAGFPGAVLTSPAAAAYLTGEAGPGGGAGPAGAAQIREAVGALTRAGLITVDPADSARTVRVHALVQNMVRSFIPAAQRDQDCRVAADALAQAWPAGEAGLLLAQSLRDNAARVGEAAGDLLWDGGSHRLLSLQGASLARAGLADSGVSFWEATAAASRRVLGPDHPDSAAAAAQLAQAYRAAGRAEAAVPLQEQAFAEQLGALGTDDPRTLSARDDLARSYLAAGRTEDAVSLCRRTVAERQRTGGPDHPDTLAARASLAEAYRAAGRTREAVSECERVLAGRQRAAGAEHPDTLTALGLLALAYRTAGRTRQAISAYQRTLAGRERVQGADHPDTLTARANLAAAYHAARRPRDAVREYQAALAGRERVQGADHPDTLVARANLASAYHSAGRLADAIPLYEQVIADYGRTSGPDHPDTLTSRSNLAHAYHTVGRLTESIELFQRTLADCEHALGASHPLTVALRENAAAAQT